MPPEPMMMGQPMGPPAQASAPSPNPGLAADALSKIREAVRLCEMALPGLPLGSDEHKTVMGMITQGTKISPASAAVPGVQATQLGRLQEDAQKAAPMQALMRMLGGSQQNAPQGVPLDEDPSAMMGAGMQA